MFDIRESGTDHRFELVETFQIHGGEPGKYAVKSGEHSSTGVLPRSASWKNLRARTLFAADISFSWCARLVNPMDQHNDERLSRTLACSVRHASSLWPAM